MELLNSLKRNTDWCFESIQALFSTFDENAFSRTINGFPVWRQFYHMLNSLDRIFTDPLQYEYPPFHSENLNSLETKPDKALTRDELNGYFGKIRTMIYHYLQTIGEDVLFQPGHNVTYQWIKLDHILSQFRHISWHIGYLSACAKSVFGETPEYILLKNN
jgi:hypothetical protein